MSKSSRSRGSLKTLSHDTPVQMETISPSAGTFRVTIVMAAITSVLAAVLPAYGFSGLEPNIAQFTEYSTHGALLSPSMLYWGAMVSGAASVIGLTGLLFFWSIARYLLLGSFLLAVVMAPFSGLGIHSPVESFLGGIGSILSVWLVSVSFWSPLSRRFDPHGVHT